MEFLFASFVRCLALLLRHQDLDLHTLQGVGHTSEGIVAVRSVVDSKRFIKVLLLRLDVVMVVISCHAWRACGGLGNYSLLPTALLCNFGSLSGFLCGSLPLLDAGGLPRVTVLAIFDEDGNCRRS